MNALSDSLSSVAIGSVTLLNLLSALVIFIICLIVIKILMKLAANIMAKSKMENGLRSFLTSSLRVVLWFLAIIIIAGTLGIPTASLVALLSVAGLALSLSVQGIMSNVFSGITILVTKPFASGEFVEIGGISGTVKSIGLFHTQINTIDNKLVYVPNSDVTASKIQNFSREPLRRVDLTFGLSYDNATEDVKAALLKTARENPLVLADPAPEAHLMSYGDSAIQYVLRAWVRSADYWSAYFSLNEAARESFDAAGVSITYNHMNVHILKDGE